MDAISAENGGTITFVKENGPTSFTVEQTCDTGPIAGAAAAGIPTLPSQIV